MQNIQEDPSLKPLAVNTSISSDENNCALKPLAESLQYGPAELQAIQEFFAHELRETQKNIMTLLDMKRHYLLEQMQRCLAPAGPIEMEARKLRDENLRLRVQLGAAATQRTIESAQAGRCHAVSAPSTPKAAQHGSNQHASNQHGNILSKIMPNTGARASWSPASFMASAEKNLQPKRAQTSDYSPSNYQNIGAASSLPAPMNAMNAFKMPTSAAQAQLMLPPPTESRFTALVPDGNGSPRQAPLEVHVQPPGEAGALLLPGTLNDTSAKVLSDPPQLSASEGTESSSSALTGASHAFHPSPPVGMSAPAPPMSAPPPLVSTAATPGNEAVSISAANAHAPHGRGRASTGGVISEDESVRQVTNARDSQEFDGVATWQSTKTEPWRMESGYEKSKPSLTSDMRGSSSSGELYCKFEVLPNWGRQHKQVAATLGCPNQRMASTKRNKSLIRKATLQTPEEETDDEKSSDKKRPCGRILRACQHRVLRHMVIHPSQPSRGIWDMLSLFLVIWDIITIPLELFDPPENVLSLTVAWVCRVFWSVDIPLSFLTGFLLPDGIIEMRPWKIARRYLMSWFAMDAMLVLLDWLEIVWGQDNALGYARAGKTSRTLRIIRMFRLLRLARMKEVVRLITERIQSERLTIVADITQIIVIIVGMAHLVACIWYGIGSVGTKGHWVQELGYERFSLGYRYMTSLHWSLSQFSGGMDEIRPHNVTERLYAVCVFLLAFVLAAVFVSSLTSSMTRLHIIASHQSRQLSVLRRYLSQNGISDRLAMRVQRNAQHAISEQSRLMPESSVELLKVVSEPLRVELHFEMHSPLLSVHPFFLRYCDECPQVMKKVCHMCMSMLLVSTGDVIFSAGEIPSQPKMYIICSGNLEYVPIIGTVTACKEAMWLSEATIWTPWMHRGVFRAMDDCRICCLDAANFKEIACSFDHPDFDPKVYAEEFVKVLNTHGGEATDLPGVEQQAIQACNQMGQSPQIWWLAGVGRTSPFQGRGAKNNRKRHSQGHQARTRSIFGRLL